MGDDFDKIIRELSTSQAEQIYKWIEFEIPDNSRYLIPRENKRYKRWHTKQLLIFRKQLTIKGTPYRIMLVKVKNQYYIEFHIGKRDKNEILLQLLVLVGLARKLAKHKYYDSFRKSLGLTNKDY